MRHCCKEAVGSGAVGSEAWEEMVSQTSNTRDARRGRRIWASKAKQVQSSWYGRTPLGPGKSLGDLRKCRPICWVRVFRKLIFPEVRSKEFPKWGVWGVLKGLGLYIYIYIYIYLFPNRARSAPGVVYIQTAVFCSSLHIHHQIVPHQPFPYFF